MYEFLRGTLVQKDPSAAIIECAGVGYRIEISGESYDALPAKGNEARLFTHFSMNAEQGMMRLFGFTTARERQLFRQLIEVQRVGPAVAMRILTNAGVDALINAIAGGNALELKKVKGVGAKMAERLIIELQAPLSKLGLLKNAAPGQTSLAGPASSLEADAIAALANLGYKLADSEKAVKKAVNAIGGDGNLSELIRLALKSV